MTFYGTSLVSYTDHDRYDVTIKVLVYFDVSPQLSPLNKNRHTYLNTHCYMDMNTQGCSLLLLNVTSCCIPDLYLLCPFIFHVVVCVLWT